MREIKFRALHKNLLTFIYGYYFYSEFDNTHYIIGESKDYGFQKLEVVSSTVGQYTGLKDKNGKEIYEGDIALINGYKYQVMWDDGNGYWCLDGNGQYNSYGVGTLKTSIIEIIGNIHSNPELLGDS